MVAGLRPVDRPVLKTMASECAESAKSGDKAALLSQRVEGNAFHPLPKKPLLHSHILRS